MGGNPIQMDYTVLVSLVFPFGFFALAAYLMVRVIRYFKRKDINDKELSQKIDELIKLQKQNLKGEGRGKR